MDEKTIIVNNQIIAKAIGGKVTEHKFNGKIVSDDPASNEIYFNGKLNSVTRGKCLYGDTLEFHSSWDWLMYVVNFIKKMDGVTTVKLEYSDSFGDINNCTITYRHKGFLSFTNKGEDLKKVTYETIVEFFKWYNEKRYS